MFSNFFFFCWKGTSKRLDLIACHHSRPLAIFKASLLLNFLFRSYCLVCSYFLSPHFRATNRKTRIFHARTRARNLSLPLSHTHTRTHCKWMLLLFERKEWNPESRKRGKRREVEMFLLIQFTELPADSLATHHLSIHYLSVEKTPFQKTLCVVVFFAGFKLFVCFFT